MSLPPEASVLKTYQWTMALVIEDSRTIAPDIGRQKTWMCRACWMGGSVTGRSGDLLAGANQLTGAYQCLLELEPWEAGAARRVSLTRTMSYSPSRLLVM